MAVTSEEFVFNPWIILATNSHILPSQCASVNECNFGNLCDFCLYTKELTLPHFPEMVFPNNKFQIRHSNGFTIEFNALDALRGVIVGEMPLKVACSEDWKMSRKQTGYTEIHVHPFDWTYTTEYSGTLIGDCRIEETSQRIDVEKLKVREEILFFKEVILFEDELHDNGIAISSVKFRAMPSGFFVLYRFFLRVDGVLVRVIDTRMHYELENSFILREKSFREAKFSEIRHNSVAVSNDPTEYLHLVPVKYSCTDKLIPTT